MRNLLSLILIVALTNFNLSAQSLLEGSISTEDGATITTATIVLHNLENKDLSKELTLDETGYFILEGIKAGAYKLEVTNTDYTPIIVDNFEFPRDTDQILGLSFDQPLLTNTTVNADTRNTPEDNLSLVKFY